MKRIILVIGGLILFVSFSSGQVWKRYGEGFQPPNTIFDLCQYDSNLYAVGGITGSGNMTLSCIARWNGFMWDSVGMGVTGIGIPYCMIEFNGELIVGGNFAEMNNMPYTRGICKWDGQSWNTLSHGVTNGTIKDMAVYNGNLYTVGNFSRIDSIWIYDVARWDGSSWYSVCTLSGGLSELFSIAVFNGELYIGGYFVSLNGMPMSNIAKFDGMNWTAVGGGLNSDVFSLYTDTINNRLLAAGNFNYANNGTIGCPSNVAYWDGITWHPIGTTPGLYPNVVYAHNNNYFVGSTSIAVNQAGDSLRFISKWDGNDWIPVDKGMDNSVHDFLTFNDDLAMCGGFTMAGDTVTNLVVAYGSNITSTPELGELYTIFPNPSSGEITLPKGFIGYELKVYELTGRMVYHIPVVQFSTFNLNLLPKGCFVINLSKEDKVYRTKLIFQ